MINRFMGQASWADAAGKRAILNGALTAIMLACVIMC